MNLNRRDPLFVTGVILLMLFLLMISVLGRMFLFLRFVSTLVVVVALIFAGIIGYRYYSKD